MSSDKPEVVKLDAEISDPNEDSSSQVNDLNDSEEPEAPKGSASPRKKAGRGKWILFLILLVGAAGGGWYFAKEQWLSQQTTVASAVEAQLAELDAEIAALRDQLSTQAQRQANAESALVATANQTEAQLLALAERVAQSESTGSGDWVLAEAEYLLRIANQRLVTSQDISGAIEMMRAADNILQELAYPELTEARRQLVADITRLGMVQPVDYEGIYFALDALLPLVAQLSGSNIERLTGSNADLSSASGLGRYWSVVVDTIRPYVVMNSAEETEPQYLMSDEQESLIKSEIQLQIRQAQLAMMANEASLYEVALNGAADSIESVFFADGQSSSLATTLRDFAQRSISGESLDISGSIRAVEKVVDLMSRVQSRPGSNGAAGQ